MKAGPGSYEESRKSKMARVFLFSVNIFILNFCYGFSEQTHRERRSDWRPISQSRQEYQEYQVTLSMKEPMKYISSPGFPEKYYPPDIQILYEIKIQLDDEVTQLSTRILMTFEMCALEDSEFCYKDGLEIANPSSNMRVYCGVNAGETMLSDSNYVRVRFFTDSEVESRGFSIRLEMYNTGCSTLFAGVSSGSFSSPNFPTRYRSYDLCVWKIEAPEDKIIRVKFDSVFEIKAYEPLCAQDYLQVSISGDFSKDVKRLCYSTQPETTDSVSNVMLFMFRTDCCFEGKGFKATFAIIEPETVTVPPPLPNSCPCGIENEAERIVGGNEVQPPNRYPWMVGFIDNKDKIFCGGALINTQYALTACHCFENENTSTVRAVLGAHSSSDYPDPVHLSEIVMHPTYRKQTYTNDIAVVKLENPVTFSREVKPLCLPDPNFNSDNDEAVMTGWGRVYDGGKESEALKEVKLTVITYAQCVGKYGGIILETNICAGGEEGQDSCQGDSGGPLFVKRDGIWHAVGVSSWGIGCGRKGYPGVYTKVPEFRKWLDIQIDDAPPCDDEISPPIQPNFEDCGIPNKNDMGRIVGGEPTEPFKYPWMAMIVYDQVVEGVGALISPHYVLTAASVFDTWQTWYPEVLDVFLGEHDLNVREPYTQRFRVKQVIIHNRYGSPSPYNNDMALLRLDVPEEGAPPQFRPICLPRSNVSYPEGLELTTAGWGRTSTNGPGSTVLMEVNLNVVSLEKCDSIYPGWVTNRMLCAYKDGKDTCKGDNGAPLMKLYNGRYYFAGLSSWAMKDSCAAPGKPRVFCAVHRNLAWIAVQTEIPIS